MNIPLTINELQEKLSNKEFSAVELVDSYLQRIKSFDSEINSVITLSENEAYWSAKSVDEAISEKGERAFLENPLLGVVVGYKDIFLTKGIRTTAGSNVLKDYIPSYSATSVKRINDAGAIPIGKLNLDAWAHGSSGENSDFGFTRNPWNKDMVPGGSSSGSGAAMASNFVTVATGTDTCGSVRLPANYCYCYGLKPTYGAVSRYGVVAMASSLDTVGNMGRTVSDIEKVFNVVKGEDGKDGTVTKNTIESKKKNYKIGIPKQFFTEGLDGEIKNDVYKQISIMQKSGFQFEEVDMPNIGYGVDVYYIIQPAEVSSNLSRYDGVRFGNSREAFGKEAKRRIMLGSYVLSSGYYDAYYKKAMQVRTIIRNEVKSVFEKVDALIAPVSPIKPFKIGEKVNDPLAMYLVDIYATTASLTGIPSLAIPSGFSRENLPLGFQIMGPRFSENMLFNIAKKYEELVGYKPQIASL